MLGSFVHSGASWGILLFLTPQNPGVPLNTRLLLYNREQRVGLVTVFSQESQSGAA